MQLLPVEIIHINHKKIAEIDNIIKSIYRLIIYSRHYPDDDLLDIYLTGMHNLKELATNRENTTVTNNGSIQN